MARNRSTIFSDEQLAKIDAEKPEAFAANTKDLSSLYNNVLNADYLSDSERGDLLNMLQGTIDQARMVNTGSNNEKKAKAAAFSATLGLARQNVSGVIGANKSKAAKAAVEGAKIKAVQDEQVRGMRNDTVSGLQDNLASSFFAATRTGMSK